MKNLSVVMAYQALGRLKEQPMNLKSSYQLLKLMQKLHEGYNLYAAAEQKLIEDRGLIDKLEGGKINFGSGPDAVAAANAFNAEHDLLDDMESEVVIDHKIHVNVTGVQISMKDLLALEDFVEFEGVETDEQGCTC